LGGGGRKGVVRMTCVYVHVHVCVCAHARVRVCVCVSEHMCVGVCVWGGGGGQRHTPRTVSSSGRKLAVAVEYGSALEKCTRWFSRKNCTQKATTSVAAR
jgi:hypothetical protein